MLLTVLVKNPWSIKTLLQFAGENDWIMEIDRFYKEKPGRVEGWRGSSNEVEKLRGAAAPGEKFAKLAAKKEG